MPGVKLRVRVNCCILMCNVTQRYLRCSHGKSRINDLKAKGRSINVDLIENRKHRTTSSSASGSLWISLAIFSLRNFPGRALFFLFFFLDYLPTPRVWNCHRGGNKTHRNARRNIFLKRKQVVNQSRAWKHKTTKMKCKQAQRKQPKLKGQDMCRLHFHFLATIFPFSLEISEI